MTSVVPDGRERESLYNANRAGRESGRTEIVVEGDEEEGEEASGSRSRPSLAERRWEP